MASTNSDGYVDLEFNADRTQAFATIYPAKGAGQSVPAKVVTDRLKAMGVMYGYREADIIKAIRSAEETAQPAVKVLVAQGVMPENGTDARVTWKVDPEIVNKSIPKLDAGVPDYLSLEDSRRVQQGQQIASIIPARPGTPGKTLTVPLMEVKQTPGRNANLTAAGSVAVSGDRLQFSATADGFVEVYGDRVTVFALSLVDGDLAPGTYQYSGGVLIRGNVSAAQIRAQGPIAIKGTATGCTLRSRTEVVLNHAAQCEIVSGGSVYVVGSLRDCGVNTPQKIVAVRGAPIVGGDLTGTDGVVACDLGSTAFAETRVSAGIDRFSGFRLDEVEEEIAALEVNVKKITQVLKPLTALSAEPMAPEKKELVQKLLEQRREIEARIRDLHSSKRSLAMNSNARTKGAIEVSGTAHPGVWVAVGDAVQLVESPQQQVIFLADPTGKTILVHPRKAAA